MNQIIPSPSPKVERLLLVTAISTTLIRLATQCIGLLTGRWRLFGLTDIFGLDVERSFPTWFTAILWFLVFGAARTITERARETKNFSRHWAFLSGLFLLMSIDEVAATHERVGWWLSGVIRTDGYLHFPFVIPGAILALVVAAVYAGFLMKLPRKTAQGMIVSGAIYIVAVIGLECLGANWTYHNGGIDSEKKDLVYFLFSDAEEFLEMLSAIVMYKVLTRYNSAA
jgi:hypothetical protein